MAFAISSYAIRNTFTQAFEDREEQTTMVGTTMTRALVLLAVLCSYTGTTHAELVGYEPGCDTDVFPTMSRSYTTFLSNISSDGPLTWSMTTYEQKDGHNKLCGSIGGT